MLQGVSHCRSLRILEKMPLRSDLKIHHTVDGSEIRQTHQLVDSLSVYPTICRVLDIPGGDRRISEPSTVPSVLMRASSVFKVDKKE